jgi:cyclopropane-fatty-acyl-phospholipid synthase
MAGGARISDGHPIQTGQPTPGAGATRSASEGRAVADARRSARAVRLARRVAAHLFGPPGARDFAVRYWDSGIVESPPGAPAFTIVLNHPAAFRRMLLPPSQLRLGEAYIRGDFDVDGDLEAARGLAPVIRDRVTDPATLARIAALLVASPRPARPAAADGGHGTPRFEGGHGRPHTRRRDAAAIRAHYDVGNDFYRLWLDRRMVYSCAYFTSPEHDIDTAQEAKLDHLCRKLRLGPGDRLLDIGCGWGGLVVHAAERYGAEAVGITLSPSQAELARRRAEEHGVADRCTIEVRDYRDVAPSGSFDAVVSVGMCEHVGSAQLGAYFRSAFAALRPGGLFMNHCIVQGRDRSRRWRARLWREGEFLHRYVFPDGELPRVPALVSAAALAGFELRDVESLREHYALTLRHWYHRLEAREAEATALVGRQIYRIWRLYMAGSAHGFATGAMSLMQMLFARPDAEGRVPLPLTRADLYRPA